MSGGGAGGSKESKQGYQRQLITKAKGSPSPHSGTRKGPSAAVFSRISHPKKELGESSLKRE